MNHLISPHYKTKKLEPPFYRDLVDVFEDRMRYWMFKPAQVLLKNHHCKIAAVGILINYFEGIEIYISGKDSLNKSQLFFKRGFAKVFTSDTNSNEALNNSAKVLYTQARCGFSHDGLFRNRVFFSESNKNALLVTWPKKNGHFIFNHGVESIVINPTRFYEVILIHFEHYLRKLKKHKDKELIKAFKSVVALKWGLDEEDRVIGMTKKEFFEK